MPAFKRVSIPGETFFLEILKPSLGDIVPETGFYSGLLGEFTVIDDIVDSRKIIDIKPASNILERRDASCNIIYKPVGSADVRRLSVTELYGATKHCAQEFYQGALKDWRNADKSFGTKILPFFRKIIRTDIVSNMYFGDTNRVVAAGAQWSVNKFDGYFTHFKRAITAGTLSGDQTFNIPAGDMTAANSVVYLENLYERRTEFMKVSLVDELAITIDQDWADAYEKYLESTGSGTSAMTNYVQNGVKVRAYRGIPIFVNKYFNPILRQITGADAHFGTLTVRGNYLFGTDKNYGEGPNLDQALRVWYDEDELTWKYLNVLKAGTAIATVEEAALALPA